MLNVLRILRNGKWSMKTIDEIIETVTGLDCEGGGWWLLSGEDKDYVLHYLKEGRSDRILLERERKYWKNLLSKSVEGYREARNLFIQKAKQLGIGTLNDPLSWDELKEMVGKPVWVEEKYSLSDEWYGKWEVIDDVWEDNCAEDTYLQMTNENSLHKDVMGTLWQAYRKERTNDNEERVR